MINMRHFKSVEMSLEEDLVLGSDVSATNHKNSHWLNDYRVNIFGAMLEVLLLSLIRQNIFHLGMWKFANKVVWAWLISYL